MKKRNYFVIVRLLATATLGAACLCAIDAAMHGNNLSAFIAVEGAYMSGLAMGRML